jgi:hypothetical protein
MIQLPIPPYPPGFEPPPFNWFEFVMLYVAGLELVLLSLPVRLQRVILCVLFCVHRPDSQ